MKTLLLLRHAKASRDDPTLDDFDRPLTARGRRAAARIGRHVRDEIGRPDLVLCSSALRTRQTLERLAGRFDADLPARNMRSLYLAAPGGLLSAIRRVPADVARLLVIGHNPGLATLAMRLCAGGDRAARLRMAAKFPTGALAELRFDAARWADIAPGGGRLRRFVAPRDL